MATEESITKGLEPLLLRGWAEIAWFLDCSETTAKRYHYYQGMPVYWIERMAFAVPYQLKVYLEAYTEAVWEEKRRKGSYVKDHHETYADL